MDISRHGNFSSSEIWKLTKSGKGEYGFGAPAISYIQEKKYEISLDRSLTNETNSKPKIWGTFVEARAF